MTDILLNSLYATIGCLGLTTIFNVKGKGIVLSPLGGGLAWLCYELGQQAEAGGIISMFMATCVVCIYGEVINKLFKIPASIIIIFGILPLVPGAGMYYTMLESITGSETSFLRKALHTLFEAGAIAFGVVIVSAIARILREQRWKTRYQQ